MRKQLARLASLLPNGLPKYVRCYDNGGETADRYLVCFTGKAGVDRVPGYAAEFSYRAMSENPFHPQGVGMWGSSKHNHCDTNKWGWAPMIGKKNHLGKRIAFSDLPPECQKLILRDYKEIWKLV